MPYIQLNAGHRYLVEKYRQLFFSFQVGHHGQSGVLVVKVVAAANKNAIGNAI